MAQVQAGGDQGRGGATYLSHITAQPDHKIVNKVWARSPPGLENRYPGLARDETRVTTPGQPWWGRGEKRGHAHIQVHSHPGWPTRPIPGGIENPRNPTSPRGV